MTKIHCLLSKQNRYIIAIVNKNIGLRETENLNDLKWICFQTRTLDDSQNIKSIKVHTYTPTRGTLLDKSIIRINQASESSTYRCDSFPINVTLLNTESDMNEYQNRGTILNAIETYQTIITINN